MYENVTKAHGNRFILIFFQKSLWTFKAYYFAVFIRLGLLAEPNLIVSFFCLRVFAYNSSKSRSIHDWYALFASYMLCYAQCEQCSFKISYNDKVVVEDQQFGAGGSGQGQFEMGGVGLGTIGGEVLQLRRTHAQVLVSQLIIAPQLRGVQSGIGGVVQDFASQLQVYSFQA